MKLLKMLILIIIILALVFFLTQNTNDTTVNLLFKQFTDVTVATIMLVSLGVGLLLGFLSATTSVISAKNTSRQLRSKNKKLVNELNQLRNVHIDDIPSTTEAIQEA